METASTSKTLQSRAAAALVALLLAGPSQAFAQTASKAAADELFKQAVRLANQGQFEAAATRFKASYEADPTLGTLLGLAMAEQRCGKMASAYVHYQELRDLARRNHDADREREARTRMSGIEGDVPRLTLTCSSALPRGAHLWLDDSPLPVAALGTAIPVDAGAHVVKVRYGDRDLFLKSLTVSQGEHARIEVPASAVERRADGVDFADSKSNGNGLKTAGIATGAAGLAMLVGGSYLWIRSNQTWGEVSAVCPGPGCSPSMKDRVDSGRAQESWARVALVAGALGVAGGVTLFALGNTKKTEIAQDARVMAGPSSVQLRVRF